MSEISAGKTTMTCQVVIAIVLLLSSEVVESQQYFPRNTFEAYWQEIYSAKLEEYSESPIEVDGETHIYRLLIMPSFGQGLTVRIEHRDGSAVLNAKFRRGDDLVSESVQLSHAEWNRLLHVAYDTEFWITPTDGETRYAEEGLKLELGQSDLERVRVDGSHWLIEATNGELYHAADAWTPRSGAIFELGTLMLQFAGLAK